MTTKVKLNCLTLFAVMLLSAVSIKPATAQNITDDPAFNLYHAKNYDDAIKLYKARIARNHYTSDQEMLALCYIGADSNEKAKEQFKIIIATPARNSYESHFLFNASDKLATMYFNEKDYPEALLYYQLTELIWEKARFVDVNWLRFHFYYGASIARCYDKMGKPDSAVLAMTPYMFCTYHQLSALMISLPHESNPVDSLKQDSVCRFYIATLRKCYSNKSVKKALKGAVKSFNYTRKLWFDKQHPFENQEVTCSVEFYGERVIYFQSDIADDPVRLQEDIKDPIYSKGYLFKQFNELPVCRMIRGL